MSGRPSLLRIFTCCTVVAAISGCDRPQVQRPAAPALTRPVSALNTFVPASVGLKPAQNPWIAHLCAVDLDRDGLLDALVCEARENKVNWLRQTAPGKFDEVVLAEDMRAPVHAEAADLDADGDLDIIVSSMSVVFPNNAPIGALFILENDGQQRFIRRTLLENVARVTDARAADFNGDGKLDLVVGQFGYDQGEIRWMERIGPWEFRSHILLNLNGTINVVAADFNGDRTLDIAALVSQQWEEIHVFSNDGRGNFRSQVAWGSTNEDYASSGMISADLNQDGRPDLIFTNGDGFGPAAMPGPRPWHGVQWLENTGSGFRFRRIAELPGAYSPVCIDMDGDKDLDVVAISAFNAWEKPDAVALAWYRNDGNATSFTPHILAHKPTHLLTIIAGNFDGGALPTLLTGEMHAYPPYDEVTRLLLWRRSASP
jgi:hypothetical protein